MHFYFTHPSFMDNFMTTIDQAKASHGTHHPLLIIFDLLPENDKK
jgi:hypothetical protein